MTCRQLLKTHAGRLRVVSIPCCVCKGTDYKLTDKAVTSCYAGTNMELPHG